MKKKCENCWIGKSYKKWGFLTEQQTQICYFQCYDEEGGDWEKADLRELIKND